MLEPVLVIMAKAPRTGAVKTRLSQAISADAVTEFYRCLLGDTLTLARSLRGVQVAIMCPAADAGELHRLAGPDVGVVEQNGDGLAAALTTVFAHFTSDGPRHVIAFNSDSPHLPAATLQEAFAMLDAHDVVVGPTHDGGYYLVGAKASYPALFMADSMGTSSALERLLSNAGALGVSVALAAPFYDIDVADDLARLAAELRVAPQKAPQTAARLEQRSARSPRGRLES